MRLRATRLSATGGNSRAGDVFGRTFLADAATGFLAPGFAYTRSGPDLWCPQFDGSLASFAANVIPRECVNGRWGFRFDPGWTQSELNSHNFGAAYWGKQDVQMPTNDVAGPGGGLAWKLRENTVNAYHGFTANPSASFNTTYTHQIVVRGVGRTQAQVNFSALFGLITFDLTTGAIVGTPPAAISRHSSEALADGYWRLTFTFTTPASGSNLLFHAITPAIGGSAIYVGNASNGLDILCSNLTNTAYPVPLTVAQGTAGTVGNHGCSATLAALGVSLGAEYTVAATYRLANIQAGYQPLVFTLSNGTFNESVYLNAAQDFMGRPSNIAVVDNGIGQSTQAGFGPNALVGVRRKFAARIKTNDIRPAWDGLLGVADTTATLPTVDRVFIGLNWQGSGGNTLQGWVEDVALVQARASTDTELQAITA